MTPVPPHAKPSRPVNESDLPKVRELALQMVNLMVRLTQQRTFSDIYALAHSQVDDKDPLAFFVLNPALMGNRVATVINPVIELVGSLKTLREGCVTFPHSVPVPALRTYKVTTMFRDAEWKQHTTTLKGREAQVFQHERDHLIGKYVYPWADVPPVPQS